MRLTAKAWAIIFIALWLISGLGLWKMRLADAWETGDVEWVIWVCTSEEALQDIVHLAEEDGVLYGFRVVAGVRKHRECGYIKGGEPARFVRKVGPDFKSDEGQTIEQWEMEQIDGGYAPGFTFWAASEESA